ncbi:tripartite tricarboxylate transporter TctB family protein [Glycomyces terrestris]|uniref:Tripartite tricarboxylate transporter TctB family protein n=1 Tax=Glycomyces terrestris TaxID=2493553 RepID=A0A426V1M0_9ACTN|nr:tripartite tricarboxylate transporter TctB family protein [Glycomyces terrestris]RRS00733.1 tripartite tricarboxylate transporter TctB family protein [Glycomyces terrestris]
MSEAVVADPEREAPREDAFEEPRPGGRVQAVAAGVAPVAIGAFAVWLAFGLEIGSLTAPGPGLWPLIVAGLLVLCGAGIVAVAATAGTTGGTEAFTRGTIHVLLAAGGLAVYASLFEVVGFEAPTLVLLFAWLRFLGRESWLASAVIAASATAVAYALFILGLGVPLPHIIAF